MKICTGKKRTAARVSSARPYAARAWCVPVQEGFTLVELLVVIAIIGILIALTMPVISRGLENARVLKCGVNLRNCGQAMFSYTMDRKGQLPWYMTVDGVTWDAVILPYLGDSEDIFLCPDDPYVVKSGVTNAPRSYACNGGYKRVSDVAYPFGAFDGQRPLVMTRLETRSGRTILLGERPGVARMNRGWVTRFPFCTLDQIPSDLHKNGKGGNYVFADMSVSYFNVADIKLSDQTDYWYVQSGF